MTAKQLKISIIGGGVYVGKLLRQLAVFPSMPSLKVAISARDIRRLRVIADHARRELHDRGSDWEVYAAPLTPDALIGSEVVILLARVGGLPARRHDETFPRLFGMVGDEGLGLGGLANAWRTIPVLEEIAGEMLEACPRGRVLNLMAPLPSTTRLLQEFGLDAIGVCELPATVERNLKSVRSLSYLGINHLGWFWPSDANDQETLTMALRVGIVHRETLEVYGAIPLPYYYRVVRPDLGLELGMQPPQGRAEELMNLSETIFSRMNDLESSCISELDLRDTPWFADALVPILASLFMGHEYRGFLNTASDRLLPLDSRGTPLEHRAVFRGRNFRIETPNDVPSPVLAFLQEAVQTEGLVYTACRTRTHSDLAAAVEALTCVPANQVRDIVCEVRRPVDELHADSSEVLI